MINPGGRLFPDESVDENGPKWMGVTYLVYEGPVERLSKMIPSFDRRPFAIPSDERSPERRTA